MLHAIIVLLILSSAVTMIYLANYIFSGSHVRYIIIVRVEVTTESRY
jgi:hypothetical protein